MATRTSVFIRDPHGFTGAEKALMTCMGLAIVLLCGGLIRSGADKAASDAKATLSSAGGAGGSFQVATGIPRAGEARKAGGGGSALPWTTRVHMQRSGAGQVVSQRAPIEPVRFTAPTDAQLQYQGGKVVSNVKVITVFWDNGKNQVDPAIKQGMPGFYQAAVNSPYMDWLSEYNTPTQQIGRGSYGGTVTLHPDHSSNSISNADIQAEINKQIDAGHLPPPDANTYYAIFFPPQVTIDLDGEKSCQTFCAYHNTLSRNGQSVYYGVMPDVGPSSQCANGCGGDASAFNNQTSVASHELIETVTDPDVGLADSGAKLGWYDQKYGEIGDICNADQGTIPGTDYVVQKEWSNQAKDCIVAKPGVGAAVARR